MSKIPQRIFRTLTSGLLRFEDGRINFTGVKKSPVINVIVELHGKILIVKRSDKVSAYQGLWNGISGFIDEPKSIEEFARQEISEELSIDLELIGNLSVCDPYIVEDQAIDRIWYVYPVLASLKSEPNIILDWEHTDYRWIQPSELTGFEHVKDFDKSVNLALSSKNS